MPSAATQYAIIIPACNEEACIRAVIEDLWETLDDEKFVIAVGVNGTTDRTTEIAQAAGALVAISEKQGYGHGCRAAIEKVCAAHPEIRAYIFFAADGANDPRDIPKLLEAHEQGAAMVLGCRTTLRENFPVMGILHIFANRLLGFWCGILTGRFFKDLGPLRLIERGAFDAMQLREWIYGWTIEAQIRAVCLKIAISEVPVRERRRIAGEQKISGNSAWHTLRIGCAIFAAGWRSRFRKTEDDHG